MAKYFGTDGIRGKVGGFKMSPNFLLYAGYAASKVLIHDDISRQVSEIRSDRRSINPNLPVAIVGRDTRGSGEMLESAIISGILAAGVQVIKLGVVTTPILALTTAKLPVNFGVMVTASHNPFTDNGVKFFTAQGYKLDNSTENRVEQEIDQILADPKRLRIDSDNCANSISIPTGQGFDYIDYVKKSLGKKLDYSKLTIVFDGANGAGSLISQKILQKLGFAKVIGIGITPNGKNINQQCGSTHIELLAQTVVENHADLGFALDGDGDRVIMVDEQGREINGDQLIAVIARDMAAQNTLHGVVVTKMSNYAFEEYVTKVLKLAVYRTEVGDRYVAETMRNLRASLGGESSGHIMIGRDAVSGDGLLTALKVISCFVGSQETSFAHFSNLFTPSPSLLINVEYEEDPRYNPLESPDFQNYVQEQEELIRGQGRIFIRKSGTQALIRLLVEGRDDELVQHIGRQLEKRLREIIASYQA